MKESTIKIHISKDFSFAEFDVLGDIESGEGLPSAEQLRAIWDLLPGKDTQPIGDNGLRLTPESARRAQAQEERRAERQQRYGAPPATANQKRVLEKYGEWRDGMTKSEASQILSDLGIN